MLKNLNKKIINCYSNYDSHNVKKGYFFYPESIEDLKNIINLAKKYKKKILCIGKSNNWFDTIINNNQFIISLHKLKKKILFYPKKNLICVTPNITIHNIINFLKKKKYTIQNIPGVTNITVGGCVSNNVHGKDSFKNGSFIDCIDEIKILTSENKILICSRKRNKEIFFAAIGGLGLIGIILEIKIYIKKIKFSGLIIRSFKCNNIYSIKKKFEKYKKRSDFIYAWIDTTSKRNIGRGIVFSCNYSNRYKVNKIKNLTANKYLSKLIFFILRCIFKLDLVKILNFFYFKITNNFNKKFQYTEEFFNTSQNNLIDLPKLIFPDSFVEIQFIVPEKKFSIITQFINLMHSLGLNSLITGMKLHKKSDGYLNFSDNGYTFGINCKCNSNDYEKINKLIKLHNFLIKKKIKIYLAKDFFMKRKDIKNTYPNFNKFIKIKKKIDKKEIFYSNFYKRITS